MNNPDTGKPIAIVEVEPACPCAIFAFPHHHNPERAAWLRRVWANDCAGDGHSGTVNTFPPIKKEEVALSVKTLNVRRNITITVSETVYELLQVLTRGQYGSGSVKGVIEKLVDHAQQGIYRPGAWEREWLIQAFGSDFTKYLEPGDPYGRLGGNMFDRPKTPLAEGCDFEITE